MGKIKIGILPNIFLRDDDTFDLQKALNLSGQIAGVCYDPEGFNHIKNEIQEKTNHRIETTLDSGHHSVYDHIFINFDMQNIPKILAMILNNEKQYTTSEKSARYTTVKKKDNEIITENEERLYNKWLQIFKIKIKNEYGNIYDDIKIKKLAQENARYLISVFMPTHMIYTTSLRQINYIASWIEKYILNTKITNQFEIELIHFMKKFVYELEKLNVLDDRLMQNEKKRSISLFGKNLESKQEIFSDIYQTTYKGTFVQFAQIQRHRTLDYKLELLKEKEYFIPPILLDDQTLVDEWYNDINLVKDINPQGELVRICETGSYDNFILKCKERLCSEAQLETMMQTKETLLKYKKALEDSNHPLKEDIKLYSKGARCTFPGYKCTRDCQNKEGKLLIRKI
ncbi:MAG: FAD-dependent thymidylate synthase [Clostridium sp.]|nr:FAD-dependent thymidylate synthase [Clostridium sp.]MCM1444213.1 FAD-dependent thymidylate synthase [Candidatus Amulumruptor caecigallinarius]